MNNLIDLLQKVKTENLEYIERGGDISHFLETKVNHQLELVDKYNLSISDRDYIDFYKGYANDIEKYTIEEELVIYIEVLHTLLF